MNLRKDAGYSQEELAALLQVSRQSVSKWELSDSVPDLDKVIRLSELFDVSTDELLRDDLEVKIRNGNHRLSDDQVRSFLLARERTRPLSAAAVMLFILSPVSLIVFGGEYSFGYFHSLFGSENMAGYFGLAILIILVAVGVGLCVFCSSQLSTWEWMEKEPVSLSMQILREIRGKKLDSQKSHTILMAAGICLCILSLVPMFLLLLISESLAGFAVGLLLSVVALGVFLIMMASSKQDTFNMLLEEDDYTPAKKAFRKKYGWVPGAYWCALTGIYLAVSFLSDAWKITWIIMAAGGLFYAALIIFLQRKSGS